MKLVLIEYRQPPNEDFRQFVHYALKRDGKTIYSLDFGDGEPEDSNLYRNFSSVFSIPRLAQLIADAVKEGCEFSTEEKDWESQWED